MNREAVKPGANVSGGTRTGRILRRKCACGQHTPGGGECEECRKKKKETLQRSALSTARTGEAPSIVHEVLRSPGQPLEPSAREVLEPRFGRDFSQVRVHADGRAAESARAVDALAYTVGREIVFAGGRYQPHQGEGLKLLSHELAHVVQQDGRDTSGPLRIGPAGDSLEQEADRAESGLGVPRGNGAPPRLQRKINLVNYTDVMPVEPDLPGEDTEDKPKVGMIKIVQGFLDRLCPSGDWKVDETGGIDSPRRDTFCAERRSPGQAHFRSSGTPMSCQCLCELTAPGAPDVRLHVTDILKVRVKVPEGEEGAGTERDEVYDIGQEGEGIAVFAADGAWDVGITGSESKKIKGAGDTSPVSGKDPEKTIRDPAWLILGHELCGHVRLGREQDRFVKHSQTPEGDQTAVDIENRIRREHSTRTGDNFGIRRGEFRDATGRKHDGSVFEVSSGDTLLKIAERCGLTRDQIITHVFRADGTAVATETQGGVKEGERLLIEGIHWHEVIRGETLERIARIWGVNPSSLRRANPRITDADHVEVGWRLLIPRR
jgi:hypothetical protein